MGKPLIIVESPAKAKTIEKFLGSDYVVRASVGHIRDLPDGADELPEAYRGTAAAKLAIDVEHDYAPIYIIKPEKRKTVAELKALMKDAPRVYLATDEDREGEAISWHLREVLNPRVPIHRLVFHEITPEAIRHALAHPRDIDEHLVEAQEARRIIDRMYGYEVSPLMWQKVRPKLSAGRVQSPAVRLVVERERARLAFRSSSWWDITATLGARAGTLTATLAALGGTRLATGADFDANTGALTARNAVLLDGPRAEQLSRDLLGRTGRVDSVESKPFRESPKPPFTTSTLQQEANRKLRWTVKDAMKSAQRLYESGWITYMRTDSVALSEQALGAARSLIAADYGADFLPPKPRYYSNSVKNAQEAHEAIRPAGTRFRSIEEARRELDPVDVRLYELIWKRTVASQMVDATGKRVAVDVTADVPGAAASGTPARFRATGLTIDFPGFRRAYVEGSDDPEAELADQERVLAPVAVGDTVRLDRLVPKGHQTQPPARLTDATLVKELEARGIGRPSTWATIIETIIQRSYVFRKGNALVPSFTGFVVTALMEQHLGEYVDYAMTARMEAELDEVALGTRDRLTVLNGFYAGPTGLHARLGQAEAEIDPRTICAVPIGTAQGANGPTDVFVRIGRFGPFLSIDDTRATIANDVVPDEVTVDWAMDILKKKAAGPRVLGKDDHGVPVYLMEGRFGAYVQLGDMPPDPPKTTRSGKPAAKPKRGAKADAPRPPRASLLPHMKPDTVTLTDALGLLSFPRTLTGAGADIQVFNGKFGPYIKRGTENRSIPADIAASAITYAEAEALLAQPAARRGRAAPPPPLKELGADPVSGGTIKVLEGKWGLYVTDGETNANLPKGASLDTLSLAEAAELIEARRGMGGKKKGGFRKAPSPGTSRVVGRGASAAARKAAGEGATGEAVKTPRASKSAATKTTATKTTKGAAAKPAATKTTKAAKPAAAKAAAATPTAAKADAAPVKTVRKRPAAPADPSERS